MQIVTTQSAFNFNYAAFDQATGLFVQASIYDVTSGTPVFVQNVLMAEDAFGVYSGDFTGTLNKVYLVISLVYTDNTYSVIDTSRAPGCEAYSLQNIVTLLPLLYAAFDQDPSLFIQSNVYDVTSSPTLDSQVPLSHVLAGVYFAAYTAVALKAYLACNVVYTDGTYSTVDTTRAPASASYQTVSFDVSSNVDPGEQNVLEGVSYEINGVGKTGTYSPPPSVDPGVQNVKSGVAYEISGVPKIGALVIPTGIHTPLAGKSGLKLDLDYNLVRISLVRAIQYITGLDQDHVVLSEPEMENVPRPSLPYVSVKILVPGARFGDDDKRTVYDENGNPTDYMSSGGPRMMTVSFEAYGQTHETAYNLMSLCQAGLDEENTQDFLRQTGIGVWTIGSVADLSQLLNTGYEGRAHMDVTFGLAANVTSNLGEIDSVAISGTVVTDQGESAAITATDT